MRDWSSYTLSDFLLFSPRVYERMYILLNQDLWPAQLLFVITGLAILIAVLRGHPLGMQLGLTALALAWMLIAVVFFQGRYEQINWLGSYLAPIAVMQSVCLMSIALAARHDSWFSWRKAPFAKVALCTTLSLGFFVYPLLSLAFGRTLASAEVVFGMPDPTSVATLGMAALLHSRIRWLVMIIPLAWCTFTGLTLWTLGRGDFFVAPLAAIVAIFVSALPRRRGS
jgi:hypothetical protein